MSIVQELTESHPPLRSLDHTWIKYHAFTLALLESHQRKYFLLVLSPLPLRCTPTLNHLTSQQIVMSNPSGGTPGTFGNPSGGTPGMGNNPSGGTAGMGNNPSGGTAGMGNNPSGTPWNREWMRESTGNTFRDWVTCQNHELWFYISRSACIKLCTL